MLHIAVSCYVLLCTALRDCNVPEGEGYQRCIAEGVSVAVGYIVAVIRKEERGGKEVGDVFVRPKKEEEREWNQRRRAQHGMLHSCRTRVGCVYV